MKYIDLGLPSGNLWAENNEEGFIKSDEAVKKYGKNLPTKEDFEELIRYTYRKWDEERKGLEILSENGSRLFIPASGFRFSSGSGTEFAGSCGYYWSSTAKDRDNMHSLYFNKDKTEVISCYHSYNFSVRLIQRPKQEYRPYESTEEVWKDIQKHGSWIKNEDEEYMQIIGVYDDGIRCINRYSPNDNFYAYEDCNKLIWLDDGTPFGKEK